MTWTPKLFILQKRKTKKTKKKQKKQKKQQKAEFLNYLILISVFSFYFLSTILIIRNAPRKFFTRLTVIYGV